MTSDSKEKFAIGIEYDDEIAEFWGSTRRDTTVHINEHHGRRLY